MTRIEKKKLSELTAAPYNPRGLVYEPFCGSGSTLIAAEQTERKCAAVELSPDFCDVIVERWENLTKKKAKRG